MCVLIPRTAIPVRDDILRNAMRQSSIGLPLMEAADTTSHNPRAFAAMSPGLDSIFTGWVDLFGGRQSARTIHFAVACLLVAFVAVHVFEVLISGVLNQLRSMITGSFRIDPDEHAQTGDKP